MIIEVGKYYYVNIGYTDYPNIVIAKILSINEDNYIVSSISVYGVGNISKARIVAKYNPNWFWKMLGYK